MGIAYPVFAFTSIIGNYSYSEMAMVYLGVGNPTGLLLLRCALLAMVVWGTLQAVRRACSPEYSHQGRISVLVLDVRAEPSGR